MSTPDARYHTKNRIVAVDIVRMLAAFAVMYEHLVYYMHMPGGEYIATFITRIFTQLSPLFFLLAGYFACRNITWKKALDNAWWCFAPFVLWNTIHLATLAAGSGIPENSNILTVHGFETFFIPQLDIFADFDSTGKPVNAPLWFMRDLIFLFLLSPLLAKWAKVIFPLCLIASLIPHFSSAFDMSTNGIVMSPRALTFFAGGCLLQTFSKDWQKKALSYCNPAFIIIYTLVLCVDYCTVKILSISQSLDLCKSVLAIWVIYQIARWLDIHSPRARALALKFAPVTFLTFAAHMLIFTEAERFLHPLITNPNAYRILCLLFPILTFAALSAFFFAMKRWCPSLLHLVAHYKLRPDDLKPTKAAASQAEGTSTSGATAKTE